MSTMRSQANNDKVNNRNFNAFYVCKNLLSCRAEFGQGLPGRPTGFVGTSAAVQALAKMQMRLNRMRWASRA